STRRFVAHTAQNGNAGRNESRVQRTEEAARSVGSGESGDVVWSNRNVGIKVDGLVLVQAEHMNVLGVDHRLVVDGPGVAAVELLGDRRPVVRVHDAAACSTVERA